MPKRLEQIPIALDQLVNTICGGWADESPLVMEVSSATPLTILALLTVMDLSAYSGKGGW